jgi:3-oxoadipate enol-lactonase
MAAAVDLAFRWDGPADAPVLVLSHAIGTSMALWEPQVPPLSQRLRVLRYDHRGHGRSPVPEGPYTIEDLGRDFLRLLDHLGLRSVAFCGLSLGGMVGMWLGANAPDRINRLVLCCTAARMLRPEDYASRAARVRKDGLDPIADLVISRWFSQGFASAHPETVASIRSLFLSTNPEGYAATCEALAVMDLRDEITRITAPTLVIAGGEDQATPVQQAEQIAAAIPGARLSVIPGAGHLANIEAPDAIVRAVLDDAQWLATFKRRRGRRGQSRALPE